MSGEIRKKNFDFRFSGAFQEDLFDHQLQRQADDGREDRGNDHVGGDIPECRHTGKIVLSPSAPKIDDDGEHRSGVKHHQHESHFRAGRVQAHEFFGHDDMRGARNRQKFGRTLNQPEKNDLKKIHAVPIAFDTTVEKARRRLLVQIRLSAGPEDPKYFWKTRALRSFKRKRGSVPAAPRPVSSQV